MQDTRVSGKLQLLGFRQQTFLSFSVASKDRLEGENVQTLGFRVNLYGPDEHHIF